MSMRTIIKHGTKLITFILCIAISLGTGCSQSEALPSAAPSLTPTTTIDPSSPLQLASFPADRFNTGTGYRVTMDGDGNYYVLEKLEEGYEPGYPSRSKWLGTNLIKLDASGKEISRFTTQLKPNFLPAPSTDGIWAFDEDTYTLIQYSLDGKVLKSHAFPEFDGERKNIPGMPGGNITRIMEQGNILHCVYYEYEYLAEGYSASYASYLQIDTTTWQIRYLTYDDTQPYPSQCVSIPSDLLDTQKRAHDRVKEGMNLKDYNYFSQIYQISSINLDSQGRVILLVATSTDNYINIVDAETMQLLEIRSLNYADPLARDEKNAKQMNAMCLTYDETTETYYYIAQRTDMSGSDIQPTRMSLYCLAEGDEYAQRMVESPNIHMVYPANREATPLPGEPPEEDWVIDQWARPDITLLNNGKIQISDSFTGQFHTIDKNARSPEDNAVPTHFLTAQYPLPDSALKKFNADNPDWGITYVPTDLETDNTSALLKQDSSVDIYVFNQYQTDLTPLWKNGYYVDLSSSQSLKDSIGQMYPVLANSAQNGGEIWGYPIGYSFECLYANPQTVPKPPQTWAELLTMLKADPTALKGNYAQTQRLILEQTMIACSQPDRSPAQREELWRKVLSLLQEFKDQLPGGNVPEPDRNANMMYWGMGTDSDPQGIYPLFALDEAQAGLTQLHISYLVVNPYSKNKEQAVKYLEALAETQTEWDLRSYPLVPGGEDAYGQLIDKFMGNAQVYHRPGYEQNIIKVVESYQEQQLSLDAALKELENVFTIAQGE